MASEPDRVVYKICTKKAWDEALEGGALRPSRDDERDGYVHLSAAHQVRGSLLKHFSGQVGLVLLSIPEQGLPEKALAWEVSRGGQAFPHLYTALRRELVSEVVELTLGIDGLHQLPEGF
jgi:uncharacterized protein (DUF952 family)